MMKIFLLVIILVSLGGVAYAAYFFFNSQSLPSEEEIESFYIVYSDSDGIGESNFDIDDPIKISELRSIIGDFPVSRLPIPTKEIPEEPHEQWMINIYFENGDQRFIPVYKDEPNKEIYEYLKNNYQ